MKKKYIGLIIALLFLSSNLLFASNNYDTLRKFLSARMYGEAYNELLRQELTGNVLDPKLKNLKKDLLDRTNDKLQKQAKTNSKDAGLYTILADIAFQKGDYDRASMYASQALTNNGGAMTNYIFSKILFRKGNISQAFEQMSKVLEAMPDSPIIFNDFQFLYTCQQYGVDTARKLTKDSSFLIRATPIAYDGEDIDAPQSPFENDPTETASANDFSDYNISSSSSDNSSQDFDEDNADVQEDLDELALATQNTKNKAESKDSSKSIEFEKSHKSEIASNLSEKNADQKVDSKKKEPPLPDETGDLDELFNENNEDFELESDSEEEKENVAKEEDPEATRIAKAEKMLTTAKIKFKDREYEIALSIINDINSIYPNLPGKEEVENKIKYERNIIARYKEAKEYYDEENFDKALKIFKEAYNYNPKLFPEAPFYIGRSYLLIEDPDPDQTLKYFGLLENDPELNSEVRRDILWTKLEILVEKEDYEAAREIYDYFTEKEPKFAEAQTNNNYFFRKLWWEQYKVWIISGFSCVIALVAFVFILQFLPDLAKIGGDPLANSQKALEQGNFAKAVKIGEKGLVKKQPIQMDRLIREVLIQAYFALEEYEKVQLHAKTILKSFPENPIAWGYLSKASIAVQDTSSEAIKMYEDMYRRDPGKRDILPMLARHYAQKHDSSNFAMEIMSDYHNDNPEDTDTIIALADGYLQNRTMNDEVVPILNDAIKLTDKIEYHEFLARTLSKLGRYEEAANECVIVLKRNINDIGIHVVYTSSMKKAGKIQQAVERYKEFVNQHPGNTQIIEIMNGLVGELDHDSKTEASSETIPKDSSDLFMTNTQQVSESLGMPGMDDYSDDAEVANYIEPIPEELVENKNPSVPIPDFMNEEKGNDIDFDLSMNPGTTVAPSEARDLPESIQTLDPFEDDDPLLEGFDTEELPEELGGTARVPTSSSATLDSLISDCIASSQTSSSDESNPADSIFEEPISTRTAVPESAPKTTILEFGGKLEQARDFAVSGEWDAVIDLLSPEFASERNKDSGKILVEAWLAKRKPEMALGVIQALDIDPEMMTVDIKDMMYKTAEALEVSKNYKDALKLYDTICNADINFKDAFDRSDRLYTKMKKS